MVEAVAEALHEAINVDAFQAQRGGRVPARDMGPGELGRFYRSRARTIAAKRLRDEQRLFEATNFSDDTERDERPAHPAGLDSLPGRGLDALLAVLEPGDIPRPLYDGSCVITDGASFILNRLKAEIYSAPNARRWRYYELHRAGLSAEAIRERLGLTTAQEKRVMEDLRACVERVRRELSHLKPGPRR